MDPTIAEPIAATGNDMLLQLGVGGVFALMLIKEVFGFIKSKGNAPVTTNGGRADAKMDRLISLGERQVTQLETANERLAKIERQGVCPYTAPPTAKKAS